MSTVYKCKSCGAPLRFDPHTGKLKCDHCDSYFFPYEYYQTRLERRTGVQGAGQGTNVQINGQGAGRAGQVPGAGREGYVPEVGREGQVPGAGREGYVPEVGREGQVPGAGREERASEIVRDESARNSGSEAFGAEAAGGTSGYGDEDSVDSADSLAVYHCPNCGAEVLTADTAIADKCVYCGYPIAFAGTLAGEFTPDYLLPFEKDVSDAIEGYKGVLRGAPFAPKEFREKSVLERFRGVYVPVWLYTMDVEAQIDVRGRVDGKKILGYTDYGPITQDGSELLTVHEEGVLHYENIARDGLRGLDDLIVRCLSPYDYWKRRAFDASYLAGFYAQRWDVDFEACSAEVRREVLDAAVYDMHEHACDLAGGYADRWTEGDETRYWKYTRANARRIDPGADSGRKFRRTSDRLDPDGGLKVLGNDVLPPNIGSGYEGRIVGERVDYALVPVWLMYTQYHGKDYMFAMNGQTGEIDGKMPVSVPRVLGYLGLTALMIFGVVMLAAYWDASVLVAGVLPVMWFLNLVRKQIGIGLSEKNAEPVRERMYRRRVHEEREEY